MSTVKSNAKPAPAQIKTAPGKEVADAQSPDTVSPPVAATPPTKYAYYRVRKLTGFLSETLKVEVDETQVQSVRVGKEDERGTLLDRLRDRLDDDAKANFNADRAAAAAAAKAGK